MKVKTITRMTEDVERLTDYYETLLGLEPVERNDAIALFDVDGVGLFIHEQYEPEEDGVPAEDYVTFEAADVDEEFRRLSATDVTIVAEPDTYPWGRSAYLRDPDGRLLELTTSSERDR